jgi:hypothetical protein
MLKIHAELLMSVTGDPSEIAAQSALYQGYLMNHRMRIQIQETAHFTAISFKIKQ